MAVCCIQVPTREMVWPKKKRRKLRYPRAFGPVQFAVAPLSVSHAFGSLCTWARRTGGAACRPWADRNVCPPGIREVIVIRTLRRLFPVLFQEGGHLVGGDRGRGRSSPIITTGARPQVPRQRAAFEGEHAVLGGFAPGDAQFVHDSSGPRDRRPLRSRPCPGRR